MGARRADSIYDHNLPARCFNSPLSRAFLIAYDETIGCDDDTGRQCPKPGQGRLNGQFPVGAQLRQFADAKPKVSKTTACNNHCLSRRCHPQARFDYSRCCSILLVMLSLCPEYRPRQTRPCWSFNAENKHSQNLIITLAMR